MKFNMIAAVLVLASGALLATAPAHAAILTLKSSPATVEVGDTFAVDIEVSDLGVGTALGVFDVDVSFDESLVTLSGASFGTGLDVLGLGSLQFATPGVSSVNLFELSLDLADDLLALQPASFVLASLSFTAASAGSSAIGLSVNSIGDANGDPLDASIVGALVTITGESTVPEPSSMALVLAALAMALLAPMRFDSATGRRRRGL